MLASLVERRCSCIVNLASLLCPAQREGSNFVSRLVPATNRVTRSPYFAIYLAPTLDSNDGQAIRGAALAARGILIQPLYIVQGNISAGKLVHFLMDWELPVA